MKTTYSSFILLVIKEIRTQGNWTQENIAQALQFESVSAWTKIENGQSPLTTDILFEISKYFQFPPSAIIQAAEELVFSFLRQGWEITTKLNEEENDLVKLRQSFLKNRKPGLYQDQYFGGFNHHLPPLLQLKNQLGSFVRYCFEEKFREMWDKAEISPLPVAATYPGPFYPPHFHPCNPFNGPLPLGFQTNPFHQPFQSSPPPFGH